MPSPTLHGPLGRTEEQRFVDMVLFDDETCWLWQGGLKPPGYGFFAVKRDGAWRKAHAHRYAYELWVGPITTDYEVDHLCRVRSCVRPDHLEAIPLPENRRRRDARWSCTHSKFTKVIAGRARTFRKKCTDCGRLLPN